MKNNENKIFELMDEIKGILKKCDDNEYLSLGTFDDIEKFAHLGKIEMIKYHIADLINNTDCLFRDSNEILSSRYNNPMEILYYDEFQNQIFNKEEYEKFESFLLIHYSKIYKIEVTMISNNSNYNNRLLCARNIIKVIDVITDSFENDNERAELFDFFIKLFNDKNKELNITHISKYNEIRIRVEPKEKE